MVSIYFISLNLEIIAGKLKVFRYAANTEVLLQGFGHLTSLAVVVHFRYLFCIQAAGSPVYRGARTGEERRERAVGWHLEGGTTCETHLEAVRIIHGRCIISNSSDHARVLGHCN